MAQGLRKHRHCYYEVNSKYYYDNHRNCMVRNTHYECMICGHEYHEVSELSQGPPKEKSKSSVLEKNKNRHTSYAFFLIHQRYLQFHHQEYDSYS